MRYVPFEELDGRPNLVVDGYPTGGTVLTLSHWRGSGSPAELAADLSTLIALNYLDRPEMRVAVDAVSNNHFDQDGVCGIWAVLHPEAAQARRELLGDVASAGDFATYRDRRAARVAMVMAAYENPKLSALGAEILAKPYPEQTAALFDEILPRVEEMLDHPERYRELWEEGDAHLDRGEAAVREGRVRIEERPEIDLAVVTVPEDEPDGDEAEWTGGIHPMAVHNPTRRHRILVVKGRRYALRYRYETWVEYVSAPTMPRIDLAPLAARLSEEDGAPWSFDGVDEIMPALRREDRGESAIEPARFRAEVESFLAAS
jgi:hypothetical protein